MAKICHPPAFLFYPDDFSSDGKVEAMTTEEVGAYILLLCKSWREKPPGSLPSDDPTLARWARLTLDRWLACRPGVLAAYTFGTDKRWHQKRMRREYDKLVNFRKLKSKAAVTMWEKKKLHARALHEQCFPFPSSVPIDSKPKAEEAAAAFLVIGFEQTFGQKPFQDVWLRRFKNRNGEWLTEVMEATIQECQERKIGIPPQFYSAKHDVEKEETAQFNQGRKAPL